MQPLGEGKMTIGRVLRILILGPAVYAACTLLLTKFINPARTDYGFTAMLALMCIPATYMGMGFLDGFLWLIYGGHEDYPLIVRDTPDCKK